MKKLTGSALFESIGYIREDYILEASPYEARRLIAARRRRTAFMRTAAVAACLCIALLGAIRILSPSGGGDVPGGDVPGGDSPATVLDAGFEIADGVSLAYSGVGVEIYVPSSVKTVSKATFTAYADAPKVTTLTLTSTETKLEEGALAPLTSLQSVIVSDGTGSGVDLASLLDMTVTDIVNNGCSLSLSYVRYGGAPVYALGEGDGIELLFNSYDLTDYSDMQSPLSETAKPYSVYVTDKAPQDVIVAPGMYIGMDISESIELGCKFLQVDKALDSGHITMGYLFGGYEIHVCLDDIPAELYHALFPWPGDGTFQPPDEEVEACYALRDEFALAPIGKIAKIEVYKAIDLDAPSRPITVPDGAGTDLDLSAFLDMTVADMEICGYTLSYSHTRYGNDPVYAVNEVPGLKLEFRPEDRTDYDDHLSPLDKDAKPQVICVTDEASQDVTVFPEIHIGMDAADAVKHGCEFYEAGIDCDAGCVAVNYQIPWYEVRVLLDGVSVETMNGFYPPYDEFNHTDPENVQECEQNRENFCRSPQGKIIFIEVRKTLVQN